jgi:hypothetical protein
MLETQELFPRYVEKLASWSFNGEFGRSFGRLVNLQMWCFGCDIRRAEGNILTEFGFTRVRPPPAMHGSSRYSSFCKSGYTLYLWGFGMVIAGRNSALCIKRFERAPRLFEGEFVPEGVFKPHDLPLFHEPRTTSLQESARQLLKSLCRELYAYERYISRTVPLSYRRACIQTSPKEARLPGRSDPLHAWGILK